MIVYYLNPTYMDIRKKIMISVFLLFSAFIYADDFTEILTLRQAIQSGLENYETIKSKIYLSESAKVYIRNSTSMLLPEFKFA